MVRDAVVWINEGMDEPKRIYDMGPDAILVPMTGGVHSTLALARLLEEGKNAVPITIVDPGLPWATRAQHAMVQALNTTRHPHPERAILWRCAPNRVRLDPHTSFTDVHSLMSVLWSCAVRLQATGIAFGVPYGHPFRACLELLGPANIRFVFDTCVHIVDALRRHVCKAAALEGPPWCRAHAAVLNACNMCTLQSEIIAMDADGPFATCCARPHCGPCRRAHMVITDAGLGSDDDDCDDGDGGDSGDSGDGDSGDGDDMVDDVPNCDEDGGHAKRSRTSMCG